MQKEIKFTTDEESTAFHDKVDRLITFLLSREKHEHLKVVYQLVNDNTNLFNKLKELEDERE